MGKVFLCCHAFLLYAMTRKFTLGWPTIRQLIQSETAKVVYKAFHNAAPDYLNRLFHRLSDSHSKVQRNSKTSLSKTDLRIPMSKTSCGQKSFEFRGSGTH